MIIRRPNGNGFSKLAFLNHEELCEDAKLWLEGSPEVSTVCLIKFMEDPPYQCPNSINDDLGQIPSKRNEVHFEDTTLQGEYGPAFYKGHRWVGQISAFIETWDLGEDKIARKRSNRRSLLPPKNPQIQIRLGDFLDIPPNYNGTVQFDLEEFRDILPTEIRNLATFRCLEMLGRRAKTGDASQVTWNIIFSFLVYAFQLLF
jgi:hypothetical protein